MTIGAGIAADVELGPLEFAAGIAADLGSRIKKMDQRLAKLAAEARPIRFRYINSYPGAASPPSPVTVVINEAPSPGHVWYVQRVGVFGSDGHTSVTGCIADVYGGPAEQANPYGGVSPDYTSQMYSGINVPTIIEEGRFHNPIEPNDQVYAQFYNVPANQQLVFAILVDDYHIWEQEAMSQ